MLIEISFRVVNRESKVNQLSTVGADIRVNLFELSSNHRVNFFEPPITFEIN